MARLDGLGTAKILRNSVGDRSRGSFELLLVVAECPTVELQAALTRLVDAGLIGKEACRRARRFS